MGKRRVSSRLTGVPPSTPSVATPAAEEVGSEEGEAVIPFEPGVVSAGDGQEVAAPTGEGAPTGPGGIVEWSSTGAPGAAYASVTAAFAQLGLDPVRPGHGGDLVGLLAQAPALAPSSLPICSTPGLRECEPADLPGALFAPLLDGQRILVLTHTRPDGDAVGSVLAWRRLLVELGKDVTCLANERPSRQGRTLDAEGHLGAPSAQLLAEAAAYRDEAERCRRLGALPPPAPFDAVLLLDVLDPDRLGALGDLLAAAKDVVVCDHHLPPTRRLDDGAVDFRRPDHSTPAGLFVNADYCSVGEQTLALLPRLQAELSRRGVPTTAQLAGAFAEATRLALAAMSSDTNFFLLPGIDPAHASVLKWAMEHDSPSAGAEAAAEVELAALRALLAERYPDPLWRVARGGQLGEDELLDLEPQLAARVRQLLPLVTSSTVADDGGRQLRLVWLTAEQTRTFAELGHALDPEFEPSDVHFLLNRVLDEQTEGAALALLLYARADDVVASLRSWDEGLAASVAYKALGGGGKPHQAGAVARGRVEELLPRVVEVAWRELAVA